MCPADYCKTKISNTGYKHIIQDGYWFPRAVKYIPQMLWWVIVQMSDKVDVIWMQIIEPDPLI